LRRDPWHNLPYALGSLLGVWIVRTQRWWLGAAIGAVTVVLWASLQAYLWLDDRASQRRVDAILAEHERRMQEIRRRYPRSYEP
jgi:hypothetical protein